MNPIKHEVAKDALGGSLDMLLLGEWLRSGLQVAEHKTKP
jgi:hypothetical protein